MKFLTLVRNPDGNLIELVEPAFPILADLKKMDEVGIVKMAEQVTLTPYFVHGNDREKPKVITPPEKYTSPARKKRW